MLHVLLKRRFPLFTCSGLNVIFFVPLNATVRTASSNSLAHDDEKFAPKIKNREKKLIKVFLKIN